MASRIPQTFLDDLLSRTEIVDLIQARVSLKKSGRNYMACCPFHHEKTPSFSVNQDRQFYHCFGCGVSGNAISFVMEFDRLDFISAVEELASKAGVEIPRDETHKGPDLKPLYSLLARCNLFYQQQFKTPAAKPAIDYLKNRGLTGEVAKSFGIGFVPEGWDHLLKAEGKSQELQKQLAVTGMLIEKEHQGYYDRFRNRIMFPIIDRRGRTIGFGGRVIDHSEPKYLNSPETPVFHKGNEVYGLYQALQAHKNLQQLIVVEGYMDVVSLAQFGVHNSVATLGTALTPDHLRLLFRHTKELIFCFDGDRAGKSAAWRALEISLSEIREGRQVKFLLLPDGEDPDTLIRQEGLEKFNQRVSEATVLSDYLIDYLSEQCDLTHIDGQAKLAALARPMVEKVTDPVFQELLANKISQSVGIRQQFTQKINHPETVKKQNFKARPKPVTPMRKAIGLLIQNPQFAEQIESIDIYETIHEPGAELLFQLLHHIQQQQPSMNTAKLLEHWREKSGYPHVLKLAGWQHEIPEEIQQDEFIHAMNHIKSSQNEQKLNELLQQVKIRTLSTEEKQQLKELLQQKSH